MVEVVQILRVDVVVVELLPLVVKAPGTASLLEY